MRIRDVIEDESFIACKEEQGSKLAEFDTILTAARLYLESEPILTQCFVVGAGASSPLRCLPSLATETFPTVNFYFYLDSRSGQDDVVILHHLLIEWP